MKCACLSVLWLFNFLGVISVKSGVLDKSLKLFFSREHKDHSHDNIY